MERNFTVDVGINDTKKPHNFDLGKNVPPTLIECKAHTWTDGGNSPSAKLSVWNEAMYYFHAAPTQYRKIMFVLKSVRGKESLAEHYISRFRHLIPTSVEIWEYDPKTESAERIFN